MHVVPEKSGAQKHKILCQSGAKNAKIALAKRESPLTMQLTAQMVGGSPILVASRSQDLL